MTPERQEWWNSLPAEEKRVRNDIDEFKRSIKCYKKHLIPYTAHAKHCIRYKNKAIQALRKQIGMRPVVDKTKLSPYLCPQCHNGLMMYLLCCGFCGQKLRWK